MTFKSQRGFGSEREPLILQAAAEPKQSRRDEDQTTMIRRISRAGLTAVHFGLGGITGKSKSCSSDQSGSQFLNLA